MLTLLLFTPSLALADDVPDPIVDTAPPEEPIGPIRVPIDVGIGPAAHLITGPVFADQPVHWGLVVDVEGVLDATALKKLGPRLSDAQVRRGQRQPELRIRAPWVPSTLLISPAIGPSTTSVWGVQFRPAALYVPFVFRPVRIWADLGLVLTYAFIQSETLPSPTHFLRPGLEPAVGMEVPFSPRASVSFGWRSQFYPPQPVGGGIFRFGPLSNSIWHIGQAYLQVHWRIFARVP